jgi:hypothetical protein
MREVHGGLQGIEKNKQLHTRANYKNAKEVRPKDPSLPKQVLTRERSPTPIFIKPSTCGYIVAALAEDLRSPFRERKP